MLTCTAEQLLPECVSMMAAGIVPECAFFTYTGDSLCDTPACNVWTRSACWLVQCSVSTPAHWHHAPVQAL